MDPTCDFAGHRTYLLGGIVLLAEFIDKSVTAPEIGYEVHDADGRYLGQVEAAWPVQRVWLVVDVDTGRDDALAAARMAHRDAA